MTDQEKEFVFHYYKNMPTINTPCTMNKICTHIEDVDFHIKQKVKSDHDFDYKILYSKSNFEPKKEIIENVTRLVNETIKEWENSIANLKKETEDSSGVHINVSYKNDKDSRISNLRNDLFEIDSNEEELTNHLIYLFYVDRPSLSKTILWDLVGKQIYQNILKKKQSFYFPVKDPNGDLDFLYEKYSIKNIKTDELKDVSFRRAKIKPPEFDIGDEYRIFSTFSIRLIENLGYNFKTITYRGVSI